MSRKLVLAVVLLGLLDYSVEAAEIRLRESLLQQQQDKATITITAVVDHIGHSAHSLGSDCDLHVPLRSRDVTVPIMGELLDIFREWGKPRGDGPVA